MRGDWQPHGDAGLGYYRLLDRLEKRSLVSRCRESKDRRTVWTRITPEGLELLARLDEPMRAAHRELLGHLGIEAFESSGGSAAPCPPAARLIFLTLYVVATNFIATNPITEQHNSNHSERKYHYEHSCCPRHHYLECRFDSLGCRVQGQAHDDLQLEGSLHQRDRHAIAG